MDKVMCGNIIKVEFLNSKFEKIDKLIEKEKYRDAYVSTAALIEIVCIVLISKVYDEEVDDSNIINLMHILDRYNEKKIVDILKEVNGEYNFIDLDETTKIDAVYLVAYLDCIVKEILDKHGNIFLE